MSRSQTNRDLEEINDSDSDSDSDSETSETFDPNAGLPQISREDLIDGLRKEILKLRKSNDVPFFSGRLWERCFDNGLGDTPISFLSKDINENAPATKGMGPDRTGNGKGFAPEYRELYKAFENDEKFYVQGTGSLDNVASVLLDGLVYAKFMGALGSKADADRMKDTFAGSHGPFFLFMDKEKLRETKKKKKNKKRTAAFFYSVTVIDFVAVPDVEQKAYLLKILKQGVKHKFITKKEMQVVAKKVHTYEDLIEKKTGKSLKKTKTKVKETEDVTPVRPARVRLEKPKPGEEGYDEYIKSQKKKRRRKKTTQKTNVEETPAVNVSPVRPTAVALRQKRL